MRRVLVAARSNPRNAQSFGIDLTKARLTAFAISGFIAGFAGAVLTLQQQALGQQVFEPAQSLRVLTMVVVGGLGSIPGAILGAVFLQSTEWFSTSFPDRYRFFITFAGSGIGLILGGLAGAQTCTPGLNALREATGSNISTLAYTVPYAIGNILLTIWGPVVVAVVHAMRT